MEIERTISHMKYSLNPITIFALFVIALSNAVWSDINKLEKVLDAQDATHKARYAARNPKETLEFFDIKPGMTVLEAFPGGGWYTKILLPYIGEKGTLLGVDYPHSMWPKFNFFDAEFIENRKTWTTDWPKQFSSPDTKNAAQVEAYTLDKLPKNLTNGVDAALYIRALHNLHRFENDGNYFTLALKETFRILKPGGIFGVVQHQTSDKNATGDAGYLNKENLIASITQAGFKFVEETTINQNPKDKADGIVWRLPPVFANSQAGDEQRKVYEAIGESNRMTLKFIKPEK